MKALVEYKQGRTQGGVLGLKPPLQLNILQKLYYKGMYKA